jgi:hypothetical protein
MAHSSIPAIIFLGMFALLWSILDLSVREGKPVQSAHVPTQAREDTTWVRVSRVRPPASRQSGDNAAHQVAKDA